MKLWPLGIGELIGGLIVTVPGDVVTTDGDTVGTGCPAGGAATTL